MSCMFFFKLLSTVSRCKTLCRFPIINSLFAVVIFFEQVNTSFVVDISEKLSPSDYIVILGGGAFASIYTHPGQEDQVSSVCFRFLCWQSLSSYFPPSWIYLFYAY